MKNTFFAFLLLSLALTGCSDRGNADKTIAVGIAPIATLVSEIAGSDYRVVTLLPEGKNPHDYTPGMNELTTASRCRLFFTTALPFEKRLDNAFGKSTRIIDVGRNLHRRHLDVPHHHHGHDDGDHDADDPHVWLSIDNDIVIAQTICDELCKSYPQDAEKFRRNTKALQQRLADQKKALQQKLGPCRGKEFFVYHGAFGYFADMVEMKQISVEASGRESDPAHLAEMTEMMKKVPNPVLFVQPGFSPSLGNALRASCGATLIEVDPLAGNLTGLFDTLGDALCRQGGAQ